MDNADTGGSVKGYRRRVRWMDLFDDMEAQLAHGRSAEREGVALEEELHRTGRIPLGERLAELSRDGVSVRLLLDGGHSIDLRVESTGADWVAGEVRQGDRVRGVIVPLASVVSALHAAGGASATATGRADAVGGAAGPAPRVGIAVVLRDLCARRAVVELQTSHAAHHGAIARVGLDHLDLAEHHPDEPARAIPGRTRIVPFAAIRAVWV